MLKTKRREMGVKCTWPLAVTSDYKVSPGGCRPPEAWSYSGGGPAPNPLLGSCRPQDSPRKLRKSPPQSHENNLLPAKGQTRKQEGGWKQMLRLPTKPEMTDDI